MTKGLFIMIEGTDGSGKTTQTKLLVEQLEKEGHIVKNISFPQYGKPSAAMVEKYLHGEFGTAEEVGPYRASIFYATDRYAASSEIKQWLDDGHIVIANRYVGSNMGHQGGKITNVEEQKKYFDWNYHLEYELFQIPKPNVNIILHVSPEISQKLVDKKESRSYLKGKKRDIHEDDIEHLRGAEQAYIHMSTIYPEFELIECEKDKEILPIKIIQEKIWYIITRHLQILEKTP